MTVGDPHFANDRDRVSALEVAGIPIYRSPAERLANIDEGLRITRASLTLLDQRIGALETYCTPGRPHDPQGCDCGESG